MGIPGIPLRGEIHTENFVSDLSCQNGIFSNKKIVLILNSLLHAFKKRVNYDEEDWHQFIILIPFLFTKIHNLL